MSTNLPAWFIDTATVLSVFGFVLSTGSLIITLIVMRDVKNLKLSFLRKATLPDLLIQLNGVFSNLAGILEVWKDDGDCVKEREVQQVFAVLKPVLANLSKKLSSDEKESVLDILKTIEPLAPSYYLWKKRVPYTSTKTWELYAKLSGVITHVELLQKDSKWD